MRFQTADRTWPVLAQVVLLAALWLIGFGLAFAQEVRIQRPSRVLDLEAVLRSQKSGSLRFTAIRANDSGLFVWAEAGADSRAGNRDVAIHHVTHDGLLLRTTPLPSGARLTLTGDFGVDAAGNAYLLQTKHSASGDSDSIFLIKVDPRGETVEEHSLPGLPSAFAVGPRGRISLLSSEATVSSPSAPTVPIAQGYAPKRDLPGAPPRWWPLLEDTSAGLVLIDGMEGTVLPLAGLAPKEPLPIGAKEIQTVVAHMKEIHSSEALPQHARVLSLRPAIRSSSADEVGNLYLTLMGTRPSHGLIVVRIDPEGDSLPTLRLGVPVDKDRPDAFGRPKRGGDGALMFPQDLAAWRGNVFVLGASGLLAIYADE